MALKRSHIDNTVSNCKKLKACNDLEPDFVNYLSVPSLESMSIVSIATALFKQSDIRSAIQKHSEEYDPVVTTYRTVRGTNYNRSFDKIEKKILDKIVSLPIPKVLKVEVSNVVRPIQLQILKWIRYDRNDTEYIDSIFWSTEGTIDKIKTLKLLIHKETGQYLESTYKLACKYCIEESIHSLWNELPEIYKKYYLFGKKIYKNYDNHLLAYWTHNISNDLSRFIENIRPNDDKDLYDFNDSIYKNMFKLALFTNNILAMKYFWNKLTYMEIHSNLAHWVQLAVHKSKHSYSRYQEVQEISDILYFLLTKLKGISITELNEIVQKNPDVILNSLFSDWPWQRFLLPTINLLWEHIDEECYVNLLKHITKEINEKKTTEHLFSRLWCDSPVNLKNHFIQKYVLNSYNNTDLFCNLLIVEKVGTIKSILEYANLQDQKQIMFSLVKNEKFFNVLSDKLHLFDDLCLDILSQSDIKSIKDRVVCEHGNNTCQKWIESGKWDKVESFLNWAFNTQEQIEHFKNGVIKKVEITYSLLYDISNYELANKFLSWCFESEEEIHKFKIHFAKSKPEIIGIGSEDWHLFEKFVDWCFNSDEEIQNFKSDLSQTDQIIDSVYDWIVYDGYKFDFSKNVINWCFNSQEEVKEFKANLALSDLWMEILQRFVSKYKIYDSDWNNWELIKELVKLVSPLDEDVIIKLKEKITSVIIFEDFRADYWNRYFAVEKKDLFRLLDKNSYDYSSDVDYSIYDLLKDGDYSSDDELNDDDYRISNDDFSSDDTEDDDYSSDCEDELNVSNCDIECELVLTEVLNNVERSLQADNIIKTN